MPWRKGSNPTMANERLKALIIGAGKIACGYDRPESVEFLTHAHGYCGVPEFELAGFVDNDPDRATQAAKIWGGRAFSSLRQAMDDGPFDAVSVTTPDGTHAEILRQLQEHAPRLIFCEKPLALSLADAEEIARRYESSPTRIQVNYLRRFAPAFRMVRDRFAAGCYGRFLSGSGTYVGGFLHNGSHMVDLLRFLLGDIDTTHPVGNCDAAMEDRGLSVRLNPHCGGKFFLIAVPGQSYWLFEMDLLFEKKRLRMLDSGFFLQEYEPGPHPLYPDSVDLTPRPPQPTGLNQAMLEAVKNIRDHLLRGEPLLCPLPEALATMRACRVQP